MVFSQCIQFDSTIYPDLNAGGEIDSCIRMCIERERGKIYLNIERTFVISFTSLSLWIDNPYWAPSVHNLCIVNFTLLPFAKPPSIKSPPSSHSQGHMLSLPAAWFKRFTGTSFCWASSDHLRYSLLSPMARCYTVIARVSPSFHLPFAATRF